MLKIERLIPGGFGLATDETGKKIFLWNALPDEVVAEYSITKSKSTYTEAIATKIATPSPFRVDAKDVCYLSTSPWQIMDFAYEQQQKASLVVEIFHEHHIGIDTPIILSDNQPYFYRNKMEYSLFFNHNTNLIELSFHERGSHRKIPIQNSSIERPEIFLQAKKIVDELNYRHDEARRYQTLLLRTNQSGEVSGGLYENKKPHPIFQSLNDRILGFRYSYSPNGFFQINLPVYELALREIQKHIMTEKVLDLYSGVGTIGLSVARDKNLTLVECNKAAYIELVKNIKSIQDTTLTSVPVLAKSEDVTNYIEPDQTVILDPPRAGCDDRLIEKLLSEKPQKIIYLSCNPATQARDVKKLLSVYRIDDIKTFNFFPRTPHIENLVVLSLF